MKTNKLGHEILRQEGQFNLCVDKSSDTPTYYVENSILSKYTKGKGISYNFNEDKKDFLMRLSVNDFVARAKQKAGNDINCIEVAKKLWKELGDIPVNEDNDLDADFVTHNGTIFEVGTDKFEVWNWFEDNFNISVAKDLMMLD
jgi:hypothetical protein